MEGAGARAIKGWLPILEWLPAYKRRQLGKDALAGLTTAAIVIPQGMGYSLMMELPAVVGLYSALLPVAIYALLGRTRELSVGPASLVCLVTASAVREVSGPSGDVYVTLVILSALISGLVMVIAGLARLGYVQHFLSDPVISGFSSASAVIIVISQIPDLLGFSVSPDDDALSLAVSVAGRLTATNATSLVLAAVSIALIVLAKRWRRRFPAPLLCMAIAIVVGLLGFSPRGAELVGPVPSGLPALSLPTWNPQLWFDLIPAALTVSLVAFVQSYAVSKTYGGKGKQRIDANRELFALGVSNLAGGLFGAFPVTGSLSRTAINVQAGAKTQIASLICAAAIALTLVFIAPIFAYVPRSLLGAIVVVSVLDLITTRHAIRLWRIHRADFWQLVVAFVATLVLGVVLGILVSVVVSLGVVLRLAIRPEMNRLGRVPGTKVYRSLEGFPQGETIPGLLLFHINAPLCYANGELVVDRITDAVDAPGYPAWGVLLDCRGVNDLDATAAQSLIRCAKALKKQGVTLAFSAASPGVQHVMEAIGLSERVGDHHVFLNNAAAVKHMIRRHAPKQIRKQLAAEKKLRRGAADEGSTWSEPPVPSEGRPTTQAGALLVDDSEQGVAEPAGPDEAVEPVELVELAELAGSHGSDEENEDD